jgi:NAD(P)-dependent dehydrogenase (short-subunit alcohol dehydrogenase family)
MSADKPLNGRVALITGASRGIGAAVALAYAKAGAHVILLARTTSGLEAVDDQIKAAGGAATLIPFDLKKIDELEALGPIIDGKFGKLDIFVANAGMLGTLTPLAHGKMKEWQDVMTVNVTANAQMIRTLDPLLRASDAGRAIFTVSGLGVNASAYWGSYGVSKAALIMMAQTYAAETLKTNLRVNMVRPGAVDTEMLAHAYPGGYQGSDLRQPDEIVPLYLELASPECKRHGEMLQPTAAPRKAA